MMVFSKQAFALAVLLITSTSQAFLSPAASSSSWHPVPAVSSTFVLHQSSQQATTTDSSGSDASSAAKFSGAGNSMVDMNRYNLPMDQIAQEWMANVVPQSSLREEGIYLGAKSSKDIMVDTVKVSLRRRIGEGLGMELLEIAGGREDGLGITVVDGIVKGGTTDGKDVMVGDSIVAVAVLQTERSTEEGGTMSDSQVSTSIATECFGYDKTVEAIGSLPPAESEDEFIVLTLKRLRRKPKVSIKLQYPPEQDEPDTTIELFAGENLRRAMLTRGIKLNDKFSSRFDSGGTGDCGADGTCATCVVAIVKGDELVSPQGTQESQILKKNPRWRMACKAIVGYGLQEGEMTIRVNPRQW
jgi:ferredoxin